MDEDKCPVCLEQYDEKERTPLLLSCCHTLCRMCLQKMKLAVIECPICRNQDKRDMKDFSTNFMLMQSILYSQEVKKREEELKKREEEVKKREEEMKNREKEIKKREEEVKKQQAREEEEKKIRSQALTVTFVPLNDIAAFETRSETSDGQLITPDDPVSWMKLAPNDKWYAFYIIHPLEDEELFAKICDYILKKGVKRTNKNDLENYYYDNNAEKLKSAGKHVLFSLVGTVCASASICKVASAASGGLLVMSCPGGWIGIAIVGVLAAKFTLKSTVQAYREIYDYLHTIPKELSDIINIKGALIIDKLPVKEQQQQQQNINGQNSDSFNVPKP